MLIKIFFILIVGLANLSFADIPGSRDPDGIKRYQGSEIVRYEQLSYDQYTVPLGKMIKFDFGTKASEFEKSETLEGAITRVSYRVADPERSSLEVFRNYENSFVEAGWDIAYKANGKPQYGNSFTHIYELLKGHDQLFTYNDASGHFLVAKKSAQGLTAALFVTKFENGLSGSTNVKKGEPIVQLDLIKTKVMEEKMVVMSFSEMAKAIGEQGKVSLYGIYFDFNNSDIKAESEPSLIQIANLLSENPKLKLLIVGHTDNLGDFEFNRLLSQKRADSVVKWLKEMKGISVQRLSTFGASYAAPVASNDNEEGRAKNRRVELVAKN